MSWTVLYCKRKMKMEQEEKGGDILRLLKNMLVYNDSKDLNGIRICTIIHKPSLNWQNKSQLFNSASRGYTTECTSVFNILKLVLIISVPKKHTRVLALPAFKQVILYLFTKKDI